MLFNSIDFALFLPVLFILYWFLFNGNLRLQNSLLVIASYVFYGWWDWRFLTLIAFSTLVDFFIGLQLNKEEDAQKRKLLLYTSLLVNLGLLGFFKYFNFFIENFSNVFSLFGIKFGIDTLNIILPVGISFYTFQTLSYTVDVYNRKLKPSKDFVVFSAYVSFFPQLVAGPIERARQLLPQFYSKRTFNYSKATDGLRQILWGLFKKLVIADNCAIYANDIFNNSSQFTGLTLVIGAICFAFQIYGDFSGYSDIAIGTSRLFGFNLMKNFNFPYFSRDIAEFWRRWHISLSTWFRDYLYIPLGGSRGSTWLKIRNAGIIFIVSGFWHGANWTFIFWGALNALYFVPLILANRHRDNLEIVAVGKIMPSWKDVVSITTTFSITVLAWVFFRAESIDQAFEFIFNAISDPLSVLEVGIYMKYKKVIGLILVFVFVEWLGREGEFGISQLGKNWRRPIRWVMYSLVIFSIGMFSPSNESPFIYFQF